MVFRCLEGWSSSGWGGVPLLLGPGADAREKCARQRFPPASQTCPGKVGGAPSGGQWWGGGSPLGSRFRCGPVAAAVPAVTVVPNLSARKVWRNDRLGGGPVVVHEAACWHCAANEISCGLRFTAFWLRRTQNYPILRYR